MKKKSRRRMKPSKDAARRRVAMMMKQLSMDGISQEALARSMTDDSVQYSVSAVQKWAMGINLPDFVSVGRMIGSLGRRGALVLWALGISFEEMKQLALGVDDMILRGDSDRIGQTSPRVERMIEEKLAVARKAKGEERARLFKELVEAGLSMASVAERSGISRQRVEQIVNPKSSHKRKS